MPNILIVDDEKKIRDILRIMISLKGYIVEEASDGVEALDKVKEGGIDLVISDVKMDKMDGLELFEHISKLDFPPPVIFITAYASVDSAVEVMRMGAVDYISKPFEEDRIFLTIEKALGISKLIFEKIELQKELESKYLPKDLICASDNMKGVINLVKKVAGIGDTTVLITGESGVGKEVVARLVHSMSHRSKKKFIAVNCAAIPDNLIESELFGHEKGAFTGAALLKKGIFESADGGTVFLDEIGDLAFDAQAKLLRALQEKKIQRVGGVVEIPVNIRIIAATNKDLSDKVSKSEFREDLYYRLNVFPIQIPPLRQRREDIIPLAEYFIKKLSGNNSLKNIFTQSAANLLEGYSFPGNIRELGNAVERAYILAEGKLPLGMEHFSFLSISSKNSKKDCVFELPQEGVDLESLEKEIIRQAMERSSGNKSAAAKLLGLTRSKLRTMAKMLEETYEEQ